MNSSPRTEYIERFLRNACRDWRTGGGFAICMARGTASRLLQQHPDIASDSIYTAIACGDVETVEQLLAEQPALASQSGGVHDWPPLLYLASARIEQRAAADNAIAIAQLLLDNGADPNAFYPGGDPLCRYTVITCVLGMGEEVAPTHPRATELVSLLFARGAEPYDSQLLYNVFANHAARARLNDDFVWLLDAIYDQSLQLGRANDWNDPEWSMLDMGGYGRGAHYLLDAAVRGKHRRLIHWMREHGANPSTSSVPAPRGIAAFVEACLQRDRATAAAMLGEHPAYLVAPDALFAATIQDDVRAAELVLDLGVSPDIADRHDGRRRALHVASFTGATNVAALLIARGADVDARETQYGATPLGVAVWAQQSGMIALLGAHSRDVFNLSFAGNVSRIRVLMTENPALAENVLPDGQSMLMRLPEDEDVALEIVALLLAHGADPSWLDGNGASAADCAYDRALLRVAAVLASAQRSE